MPSTLLRPGKKIQVISLGESMTKIAGRRHLVTPDSPGPEHLLPMLPGHGREHRGVAKAV